MKIEGAGEVNHSVDLEQERGFETTKYDIGRNTKEMVNKIFRAASSNNQDELNSLLDQVETRARDMVKSNDLPDHGLLAMPRKHTDATSNQGDINDQMRMDISKNINNDSQLQMRNDSAFGLSSKAGKKERTTSQMIRESQIGKNVDTTLNKSAITSNNMSEIPNNYQVSFDY